MRCPTQGYESSILQILLTNKGEPLTCKEGRTCQRSNNWELAMQEAIKALLANTTCDFV